jgi:tripartite-type tricarboxylate transporter receptor subunit TctC
MKEHRTTPTADVRPPARRRLIQAASAATILPVAGPVWASGEWPQKPVKIVSPYPAGGSNDNVARQLAARLSEMWNQRVLVENKPGANNRIATQELARATPDGYHLMLCAAPHGANPGLYGGKLPYDTLKDFTPIMRAIISPVGFWVSSNSPYKTMKDLGDAARSRPGRLFAGSPGIGSGPHLVVELFNYRTGLKLEHLPHKGDAPLAIETVAGRVDVGVTGLTVMRPHLEAGRVRLLAVSSSKRMPILPKVPTLIEAGFPQVEGYAWFGLIGPAGLPRSIVDKVNRDANIVMARTDVRTPLEAGGMLIERNSPEEFARFVREDVEKWIAVAKATGMSAQ